ncbi:envelope [Alphacoronavirus sp.]|uniref:Envelope n=1 Tax=alphacoronavirus sp. WA2028 TaxID=3070154 RepID=A0AA48UFJ5_9ALPC|nr:envelope [Alphacoronavirus sp.]QGX41959.1 envelope [alphacoronavirus sp. WA2028]QGX41965.1 envelope [Alphacoronavirus sp.]
MYPFHLVDQDSFLINAILLVFLLIFVLLLCITFIKLVQLCLICHHMMSGAVYQPIYKVYRVYKDFMRIEPMPTIDV